MNAIEFAIRDVLFEIPNEILEVAFLDSDRNITLMQLRSPTPYSLSQAIREKVIDYKVIPDCDMVGGTQHNIALRGVRIEQRDPYTTVINIPDSLTMGKKIISLQNLYYGWPDTFMSAFNSGGITNGNNGTVGCGSSQQTRQASRVLDSTSQMPEIQTTNIALTGHNTITIYDTSLLTSQLTARVTLEYDEQLSTINPRAYPTFSQLVMYAVKAYIYSKLAIAIDQGRIVGGVELGKFADLVDTYNDAITNYNEFRDKKWKKTAGYSDKMRKHRAIKMTTPKR